MKNAPEKSNKRIHENPPNEPSDLTYGQKMIQERRKVVIAYIDVSGYRDILTKRGESELFASIHKMVQAMNLLKLKTPDKEVYTRFATDSGLIYFEDDEDDKSDAILNGFITILGSFQYIVMTECNILIRGGVTTGYLYDNGFIFGDGYLSALRMESELADYSRIIVEEKVTERLLPPVYDSVIYKCPDDYEMIDYVSAYVMLMGEGSNPAGIGEILKNHKDSLGLLGTEAMTKSINDIIEAIARSNNPTLSQLSQMQKINERYSHILDYHNYVCDKFDIDLKHVNPHKHIKILQMYKQLIESLAKYKGDKYDITQKLNAL